MFDARSPTNRWLAWPLWILGGGVGAAGGFLLAAEVLKAADIIGYQVLAEPVIFALLGAGVGAAQALAVWRRVRTAIWWVLASAAGCAAIATLAAEVDAPALAGPAVGFSILGLTIGLFQWPILRRHVRRAGWWPLASALGWGLGALTVILFADRVALALPELVEIALLFGVAVGISGVVTALALVWLTSAR